MNCREGQSSTAELWLVRGCVQGTPVLYKGMAMSWCSHDMLVSLNHFLVCEQSTRFVWQGVVSRGMLMELLRTRVGMQPPTISRTVRPATVPRRICRL